MKRYPLQGVSNIIRFNSHFFVLSGIGLVLLIMGSLWLSHPYSIVSGILAAGMLSVNVISLLVSFYVYDLSGFYQWHWAALVHLPPNALMVNIHAGFDETSHILQAQYPLATLAVFDFYNPRQHTEISIRRARKVYPPYPGTVPVATTQLPLPEQSVDLVWLVFAAHEIRNADERQQFFKELFRALKSNGQIIVVEHLRDRVNFLAYNIGFLHFYPASVWRNDFAAAGFTISTKRKKTPFITIYTLSKNGMAV